MRLAERRAGGSLLHPGMEIMPGEAYCLACPWHVSDDPEAPARAVDHRDTHHHPTASRPPENRE